MALLLVGEDSNTLVLDHDKSEVELAQDKDVDTSDELTL